MAYSRIAAFGDVHGSLSSLKKLYGMLEHESLDAIFHLGDLIDRGPEPGAVLAFCQEKGITGPIGNHESALLERHVLKKQPPNNPDKLKSYTEILEGGHTEYLKSLPKLLVIKELETILVHAGINVLKPLEAQNRLCCYVDMLNEADPGNSRWSGTDRKGRTEKQNRDEGWFHWSERYDFPFDVYCGHKVVRDPITIGFANGRNRTMLDTGAWWTGKLSAAIITGPGGPERFVSTPRLREPTLYEVHGDE